jgi:hypothetical protein
MAATDAQRVERAIQLLDARLAKSDLFTDGTVKVVPSTSNVGEYPPGGSADTERPLETRKNSGRRQRLEP